MARSRRFSTPRSRKSSRPKADWVYRSSTHDTAGTSIDDLYSYDPIESVLVAGIATANFAVLYDSHNATANALATGPTDSPRTVVLAPARAEGGRAFIHRVQGTLFLRPSVWAVGNTWRYGIRFGIFEQDALTRGILVDPNYSLWNGTLIAAFKPANWANDRKWQHERRWGTTFSDNAQLWMARFNFPVRRSLMPHECYGFYSESYAGSVNLFEQKWFRTLVSDEA